MPRPLFTSGKDPVPIVQAAGWAPGLVWTGAENLAPTEIRSPDRPTRSQSLYRLRYPAHTWRPRYMYIVASSSYAVFLRYCGNTQRCYIVDRRSSTTVRMKGIVASLWQQWLDSRPTMLRLPTFSHLFRRPSFPIPLIKRHNFFLSLILVQRKYGVHFLLSETSS